MTDRPTRTRAATEEKSGSRRDRERPPAPEPLPHPVVDNHCHLDIADADDPARGSPPRRRSRRPPRSASPGSCRSAATCPAPRWAVEAAASYDALVAGVALHPNEAPRHAAAGTLEEALAEIERLAQAHDKVRAVGETGLDHFRTGEDGPGRAGGVVPPPHRPRQAAGQDPGHPRPRRPRRGAGRPRRGGRARALGDALLLRRRRRSRAAAWTGAPTCPSPGR